MKRKADWDTYSTQLVAWGVGTATDYELLTRLVRGRVLDAGCGVGIHLGRMVRLGVEQAVGVDLGIPGLHYGKENFANAIFIAASLYHLPFRSNHYDLVYSIDVVEHLDKPLLALHEYYRVCKSGGFVFVQTPNYPVKRMYDFWHWLRRSNQSLADDPTHFSRLNSFGLKKIMIEAGFQVVSICARNIAFQRFLPGISALKSNCFGHCLGQKVIIIGVKP